jgi:hypothetical protein
LLFLFIPGKLIFTSSNNGMLLILKISAPLHYNRIIPRPQRRVNPLIINFRPPREKNKNNKSIDWIDDEDFRKK